MQWKNPGYEFDQSFPKILSIYQKKNIVIYGAGMVGGRIYDMIVQLTDLHIIAFLDQDDSKKMYKNLPVYHGQEGKSYLSEHQNVMIVIGLLDYIGKSVKRKLTTDYGIREECCKLYSEFIMHDFPILTLYKYHKVFLDTVSMIVTEQCTLRCEKCSIMLPYFKHIHLYSLEKLFFEADTLFQKVDFVGNFTITGGEPLLYEQLCQFIEYIGEHYRNQIGSFKIITNGTVIPSEELLFIMNQYDMAVEISDYTVGVPAIKPRVKEVREVFEKSGIKVYFLSFAQWVDFGFETVDNQYPPDRIRSFFNFCHTRCRGYVDGKLWYCINAYFAERTLYANEDEKNAFDIVSMTLSTEDKRKLVEFDLGYNSEGYLNMCQHCNGTVEINENYVEVGKQCMNH